MKLKSRIEVIHTWDEGEGEGDGDAGRGLVSGYNAQNKEIRAIVTAIPT